MKKIFVAYIYSIFALSTFAYDVNVDGIYYNLISKANQAEVTCKGTSYADNMDAYKGAVTIPETITVNGQKYNVTKIGDGAFEYNESLTSLTIPKTITKIGRYAFSGTGTIKKFIVPEGVAAIEYGAFQSSNIDTIVVSNSVISLGDDIFASCYARCIILPNNIKSIPQRAFEQGHIKSIKIPSSVKEIGNYAFYGCIQIKDVYIDDLNSWCSLDLTKNIYDSPMQYGGNLYLNGNKVEDLQIYSGISKIGSGTFQNCSSIKSVSILGGVSEIEAQAFANCENLTNLAITKDVKNVGCRAFYKDTNLSDVYISDGVTTIDAYAFCGCTSLKKVTLPKALNHLGVECFSGCNKMDTVICYAENVPSLETDVFKDALIEYSTLIVPNGSILKYQSSNQWKNFGSIIPMEGSVQIDTCAVPSISLKEGKLHFSCNTKGAEIHYSITPHAESSISGVFSNDVDFYKSHTYLVVCYATADGYIQSKTVSQTITIDKCDVNCDGKVTIADANEVINAYLTK